jgi:hypothetical protein
MVSRRCHSGADTATILTDDDQSEAVCDVVAYQLFPPPKRPTSGYRVMTRARVYSHCLNLR